MFHLSKLLYEKLHTVLHTVWCNISGEAAGEIWNWSLLGVKGIQYRAHEHVCTFASLTSFICLCGREQMANFPSISLLFNALLTSWQTWWQSWWKLFLVCCHWRQYMCSGCFSFQTERDSLRAQYQGLQSGMEKFNQTQVTDTTNSTVSQSSSKHCQRH